MAFNLDLAPVYNMIMGGGKHTVCPPLLLVEKCPNLQFVVFQSASKPKLFSKVCLASAPAQGQEPGEPKEGVHEDADQEPDEAADRRGEVEAGDEHSGDGHGSGPVVNSSNVFYTLIHLKQLVYLGKWKDLNKGKI